MNDQVKVKMGGQNGAAGQKRRGESKKIGGPKMAKLGENGRDLEGLKVTKGGAQEQPGEK